MSVCAKCKKEASKLKGTLGGPLYCEDCYVEPEKKPYFDYEARGNTGGDIKKPSGTCGICGHQILMPTPTGIWIHYGFNHEDFVDETDHEPRLITTEEELLLENYNEEKINGNVGSIHYYGKDGYGTTKERYVECLIHRKYWIKNFDISKQHEDKLIFQPIKFDQLKHKIENFLIYSQRNNALQFEDFIKKSSIKIKSNPGKIKNYYEFYITKGVRNPESILAKKCKEFELDRIPKEYQEFKIEKKNYVIYAIYNRYNRRTRTKQIFEVYLKNK